jgi:hypothetical protein
MRSDEFKELEIVVLRHELAVALQKLPDIDQIGVVKPSVNVA